MGITNLQLIFIVPDRDCPVRSHQNLNYRRALGEARQRTDLGSEPLNIHEDNGWYRFVSPSPTTLSAVNLV